MTVTPQKFGAVDVGRWHSLGLAGGRVLVDGVDVTNRCRWFDDVKGRVECLLLNESGRPYLLNGAAATETIEGVVEIVPPEVPNAVG